jgi:hypothetical protein
LSGSLTTLKVSNSGSRFSAANCWFGFSFSKSTSSMTSSFNLTTRLKLQAYKVEKPIAKPIITKMTIIKKIQFGIPLEIL